MRTGTATSNAELQFSGDAVTTSDTLAVTKS